MVTAVETFRPAFGRMEQVEVDGHALWLALIKNPVGFNQVLATIAEETAPALDVLVMINDRYADGRDVSWLWDVDLERYLPRLATARWWVSGLRAWDMAVRLKYAGVLDGRMRVEENAEKALTDMVRQASGDVFVLPTYTAMLEIRQYLTQRGYVRHFREG
jgi:UDP-N-acetylmuramyl tripeptide synthase